MKSTALELGKYKITVNALVPGLIDTPLTRHEERYAQVLELAGRKPTGNLQQDEATAKQLLQTRSPLGVPWIDPSDLAPSLSSSHPTPRVWSLAPPTTSLAVTAQTTLHKPKYPVHAASPVSNSSCGPLALVEHVGGRHTPFRRPMPGRPNPVSGADGVTAGKQSNLSLFLLTTVPAGRSSRAVSAATVPATPSS
jgi:hypothetical protein